MIICTAIEEALDNSTTKISWHDLAKAAGISKSALSHFKNGTELKFPNLLSIAKFVFKNDYINVFKDWCLNLTQPKNIRYSLEYLAVNRHVDELEVLIGKINKRPNNQKLVDWASTYSIILSYLKGDSIESVIRSCRTTSPKSIEMKILIEIVLIYCRLRRHEYTSTLTDIQGLDIYIQQIEEDFVKESFSLRLKEVQSYLTLYKFNDPIKAREYAEEIISSESSAVLVTNSYYIVGMSYLFDNYDKCLGNIMKYRELLVESGRVKEINEVDNNDLPFINNIWKKHQSKPETNDISEIAHYEAVMGNKELAVELIDKAINEDGQSGFKLYYKALITNDTSLFMHSLIHFISKKGDKFYANLPYMHLKSDPVYKPMADTLFID